MAAAAPAFGMIGTLVGLIVMLQSLTANPDGVGDGLAVAMLTTLYGVLVARLVFIPAASKISQKEGIMRFRNFLITEGFAMLAEQKSPRFIQDKMNSYLDPSMHYNIAKRVERRTNNGRRPTRRKIRTAARVSPYTITVMRSGSAPRLIRNRATAAARAADSSQFDGNLAVLMGSSSVWPSTSTL